MRRRLRPRPTSQRRRPAQRRSSCRPRSSVTPPTSVHRDLRTATHLVPFLFSADRGLCPPGRVTLVEPTTTTFRLSLALAVSPTIRWRRNTSMTVSPTTSRQVLPFGPLWDTRSLATVPETFARPAETPVQGGGGGGGP